MRHDCGILRSVVGRIGSFFGRFSKCRAVFICAFVATALWQDQWAAAQATSTNPPYAEDDMAEVAAGGSASISVLDNDYGVMASLVVSSVKIANGPLNGTAVVDRTTGEVWYTPDAGFEGTDSFSYTVVDSNGLESNVAMVSILVPDMDAPPEIGIF